MNVENVPLRDLCEVRIGRTPSRSNQNFWGGPGVWLTISELNGGELRDSKEHISELAIRDVMPPPVPTGTLLFSFKLSIGKMGVSAVPLYTNEAIAALPIRDPKRLDREYLRYALMATSGSVQANHAVLGAVLNKAKVEALPIPVRPISEQRRIVDLLSRAENIVRMRREAEKKAKEIIPALFLDMFGDPATNPKGWEAGALGSVTEIQGGLQVTAKRASLPLEAPYLRVANVYRTHIDLSEIKTIRLTAAELDRTRLNPGDLLVIEGHGNPAEVGRVGIWPGGVDPCSHQNHLIRVRCDPRMIDPHFVWAYLNSASGRLVLLRQGKTTSGLNTISVSNVKSVVMPLPPLRLQRTFAEYVRHVEILNASQASAQHRAEQSFKSLLAGAFWQGDSA